MLPLIKALTKKIEKKNVREKRLERCLERST